MTWPPISKKDAATIRIGAMPGFGLGMLSVAEAEQFKTIEAAAAVGEVKKPKRSAPYEERDELAERIANGEDVDNDEEDWL